MGLLFIVRLLERGKVSSVFAPEMVPSPSLSTALKMASTFELMSEALAVPPSLLVSIVDNSDLLIDCPVAVAVGLADDARREFGRAAVVSPVVWDGWSS